jgi:hypothetical protein
MQLSKDGGAFAQKNAIGNATHDTDGWYSTTLDATDTATVGILILQVNVTGALPVWHEYYVVEEAVYDALYAANAPGYLQPTTAGRTVDVTTGGAVGIDWANVENPTTTVDLSSTSISLCDTTTTNTDMRGTDGANTVTPPAVGDIADAVWDEDISKAEHNVAKSAAKTLRHSGDITQIDGMIDDVSPTTTGFDTNLTQVDGYFRDQILIFTAGAANEGVGTAIKSYVNANGRITFDTLDGLAVTPTNGDEFVIFASHTHPISQVADGVWDEAQAGHTTAGTFGKYLDTEVSAEVTVATNNDKTGYSISGTKTTLDVLNDVSAPEVNAEVVDVLTVDTFPEVSGVPGATSTILDKLSWLFSLGRNKITQTSTTQTVRDDTDTSDVATSTVSDDGTTFTRGKYS